MSFQPIPVSAFASVFPQKGFAVGNAHGELVYEREHEKVPGLAIRVYTSLSVDGKCRGKGHDAVRACLVYTAPDGSRRGVTSAVRVNRTGTPEEVVGRALARARAMWESGSRLARSARCGCGAPTYPDSGRCVARCGE